MPALKYPLSPSDFIELNKATIRKQLKKLRKLIWTEQMDIINECELTDESDISLSIEIQSEEFAGATVHEVVSELKANGWQTELSYDREFSSWILVMSYARK